jgi:hypothetical protein
VALLTVSGVVSGCGESAKASLHTNGPITKTEAITYAQAVNLTPADVPEMVSVSRERERKPERGAIEEARCTGGPGPFRRVVILQSPTFRSGSGRQVREVQSEVEVRPSAALATRSLAIVKSTRERACLARLGRAAFARGVTSGARDLRFRVGRIAVFVLPDPLPQAGSFGLRILVPLTFSRAGGVAFHTIVYVDELGFIAGPAEVSLTAWGFSGPVPTATEQRLLSLLYRRA